MCQTVPQQPSPAKRLLSYVEIRPLSLRDPFRPATAFACQALIVLCRDTTPFASDPFRLLSPDPFRLRYDPFRLMSAFYDFVCVRDHGVHKAPFF